MHLIQKITVVLALRWATGCAEDTAPTDHAVSFATQVAPFLRTQCGTCHVSASPAGGLILDGSSDEIVANLVDQPARSSALDLVEPGDPSKSFLVLKLTGELGSADCAPAGCGAKMPLQGTFDATAQEHLVHWISDGAP